ILPLGLFMAVLLAFSRLYKDSEMTAMTACGVTLARVYRPVLMLAFAVALVVGAVSFFAAPWAEERSYQIRDDQQAHAVLAGIAPGRFTRFGGSRGVFYFQRLSRDGETMYGIFAPQQCCSNQTLLSAERGYSRLDAAAPQTPLLAT